MRLNQRFIRIFACVVASVLLVAPMFGQAQSGNIFGKVVDNQKAALPGVTVTLSGVGATQVFVTDTEGQFRYLNLSPGVYSLTAELSGFGSVIRNNVQVNLGRNSSVELELTPALEQTITVTAETPLLDVRKSGTGATVTGIELEEVPSARDPWVILQQVPGVLMDRINVGGNQSGQQSQFTSKGSTGDQASFNVDGVTITDMAATGSSAAYYDFGSFEEIQVSTGGTDPRVMTPGAQINMVTKRGSNEFSGSGRYYLADSSMQSSASIPAEAQSYLTSVNKIDRNQEWGLDIGGPVVKDRLWLWGAYALQNVDLIVAGTGASDKTELKTTSYKLNAQITSSNSAVGTWSANDKVKIGRNVSATRLKEAGWNQSHFGPEGIWKIEDTHIFNPNFYLTGLYSKVNGGFQLIADGGQGCADIACGMALENSWYDAGVNKRSYLNETILRPQDQYRADASFFFDTGSANHELKFGFGYRTTGSETFYNWPQYQRVIDFGPGSQGVYLFRTGSAPWETTYSDFYVGDTILMGNLTIQAGLRYDDQGVSSQLTSALANPLIPDLLPALSIPGDTYGTMTWTSLSPRLGLTWSLGDQKKTLIRAAYNRYVGQVGGNSGGAGNNGSNAYAYMYFYMDDANNDHTAQLGEIDFASGPAAWYGVDPDNPAAPIVTLRYDKSTDAPTTDEIILGGEHEITPEFTLGLTYTHRKFNDFTWYPFEKTQGAGDWYTAADYELGGTLTAPLPDGTTTAVPWYQLKAGTPSQVYQVVRNRPGYSQTYDGLELTAIKRMSNRWMLRGNFSWNDWTQSVSPEGYPDGDPTQRLRSYGCASCDGATVVQGSGGTSGAFGGVYINSEWSYIITGVYQIPVIETNFGINLSGRQGYPQPWVHETPNTRDGGRKSVLMNGVDGSRHADVMTVDLRLSKDIRLGPAGLTISIDAFNVTNEQTILQRNLTLYRAGTKRPTANRITELVSPQIFRIGARLTF